VALTPIVGVCIAGVQMRSVCGRCQLLSRLGLMHLIATNVCMWIRAVAVASVSSETPPQQQHSSADVMDNTSSLLSGVTPGALYSLLHHNATASPPAAAAATQRIHLSVIGLMSQHYSMHMNATGQSPSTNSTQNMSH